ncbi:MAG: AmmeMemoRadiSam system radical SAM enzyme [Microgenomates group bacterium]
MKEALLYTKLPRKNVRCGVCQRRCVISNGKIGYCRTRLNKNGKLYTTIYGVISSLNNDPIEKKPVFHFAPGTFCLSAGTFGCNFRCLFCQNWEISWADGVEEGQYGQKISPEELIKLAEEYHSAGIAITYNEPAIWLEYSLDVFKLTRNTKPATRNRLYTVWVTNGYATPEAIDLIAPYLDVYRVDLKSFDDHFYQKLINVPSATPIFETTAYVKKKYPKIHIECVTNIIPEWNDDPKMLKKIASWIVKNLGPKTPWHVTRFFPYAKLTNVPPTPPQTLFKAREIGLKEGLEFVYIGNLKVDKEDDTFCPKCGSLVIQRQGYYTQILGLNKQGKCLKCGEFLNIQFPLDNDLKK